MVSKLDMITLSAGIAQTPEHGTSASELLRAADEAMYAAKQAGGDRIVIYQPVRSSTGEFLLKFKAPDRLITLVLRHRNREPYVF
jgi:hypothetical protein